MLSVEASVAAVMQHMGTTAPTTTPLSLSLSFCRSRGAGFPPTCDSAPLSGVEESNPAGPLAGLQG